MWDIRVVVRLVAPVLIQTYIHTNTYMHTYIRTHAYIHTHTRVYIHTHIHTYIHTHIHTYIHTYTRMYVRTHIFIHTHTYIHTYIHTYKHTYKHTYVHTYIHTYIHTHTHTRARSAFYTCRLCLIYLLFRRILSWWNWTSARVIPAVFVVWLWHIPYAYSLRLVMALRSRESSVHNRCLWHYLKQSSIMNLGTEFYQLRSVGINKCSDLCLLYKM